MEFLDDRYNMKARHTVQEYKDALKACRSLFPGTKYLEMLRANYYAPEHTITAGQLADAVGYATYGAANLQYGTFAGVMAKHLGHEPGKVEGADVELTFDVAVLVAFGGGGDSEVTWRLLPALVQALEEMRWVKRQGC